MSVLLKTFSRPTTLLWNVMFTSPEATKQSLQYTDGVIVEECVTAYFELLKYLFTQKCINMYVNILTFYKSKHKRI